MIKRITKRLLYAILYSEILILGIVFLAYLLSSQDTLRYILDKALIGTKISYSDVSGNLLDKVKVKGLKYDNHLIADSVEVDWSLRSLFGSEIVINEVDLKAIDIKNIQDLFASLKRERREKAKKSDKKGAFFIPIKISHLKTSLLPYQDNYIDLESADIELKNLLLNKKGLGVENFSLKLSSNYSPNLYLQGKFAEGDLVIDDLSVDKLNIETIKTLIANLPKSDTKNKIEIPLKKVTLERAKITTEGFDINRTKINDIKLLANDVAFDTATKLLNAKGIDIKFDSNILRTAITSTIVNNRLKADSTISLKRNYLSKKVKIIDFESLNPLKVSVEGNLSKIEGVLVLKSNNIFRNRFQKKNVRIRKLTSRFSYDLTSKKLKAVTDANLSEKYAKTIILHDTLTFDKTLKYGGVIKVADIEHFPKYTLPLFEDAKIIYDANLSHLDANLTTTKFKLNYKMKNYKEADFSLHTPKDINLSELFSLPKDINRTKAKVSAFMHLDFHKPKVIIDTNISSNLLDLSGKIDFKEGFHATAIATLPKDGTILSKIDKRLKLDKLFPSDLEIRYKNENLHINLQNSYLSTNYRYNTKDSSLESDLKIAQNSLSIKGDKKLLLLHSRIPSLEEFMKNLSNIYKLKPIELKGQADINGTITDLTHSKISIHSKWITYEYAPYKLFIAQKIRLNLSHDANQTVIDSFSFNTFLDKDRRFFSTKKAIIHHTNGKLELQKLLLNDEIPITGEYDKNSSKGIFNIKARHYHYNEKDADIHLSADLSYKIDGDKSDIDGKIILEDGVIRYKYRNTHTINDPDIIFVQEMKKREAEKKAIKESKLAISITITSKRDIRYQNDNLEAKFVPDFTIWKERGKELEFLGRIIIKSGEYTQGAKLFTILSSELIFGGEIANPYLNLKASYKSDKYDILISIGGRMDSPIINFSSTPYLSQSDILSILLFDSTATKLFEGTTNSSNQAITLFGNTLAKEIVQNFGIKLDRLVLMSNEEGGLGFEVGKKLTKKVTVIYTNDIVQSLKIRYHHSDSFETDIMISPESSGIDFIYKREH